MDRRSFIRSLASNEAPEPLYQSLQNKSSVRERNTLAVTLDPWNPGSGGWQMTTIQHLFRRAGFGATPAEIAAAASKNYSQVVDELLDNALTAPPYLPAPPQYSEQWLNKPPYLGVDYDKQVKQQNDYAYANMEIRRHWTEQMAKPKVMLREKLTLFWMNHFVVEASKVYYPQMMYSYLDYFRRNAWGNFKQMVKDVTIHPAMLIYLDGQISYRTAPNENYARELLELFTLGVQDKNGNFNYTEEDIRGLAKALTGYRIQYDAPAPNVLPSYYETTQHDSTFKTIFGVKKQWGLGSAGVDDDVIDLIFDKKKNELAWFICAKLYQFFVYYDISGEPEQAVIDAMASLFIASNWELKPVLSALLKSEHFFAHANIGDNIKSPYEYAVGLVRHFGIEPNRLQCGSMYYYNAAGAQVLLDPPNVKGWPGYRSWISTTTLPYRNLALATQLLIAKSIPAVGSDGYGTAHQPLDLNDATLTNWVKNFPNYNGNFDLFFDGLCIFFCAQPPSDKAKAYIKAKLPPNVYEWQTLNDAEKIVPLRTMIKEILLLADYQLC